MVNYANGKIYKIVCNTTGLCYIGSTCSTLAKRLNSHKKDFKRFQNSEGNFITSFKVLENNNYIIELVELVACDNKIDLHKRERFHIENIICVNKYIVGRTDAEYRAATKDRKKIVDRQYALNHVEQIKLQQQKYYSNPNNAETAKARSMAYYTINADIINARNRERRLKAKTINDLLKIAVDAIVVI